MSLHSEQETFLRVHRARERYQPTARFSTWLYRIATNLALNELRRPRRTHVHASTDDAESPLPELAATSAATDELVDARRLAAQVDEVMSGLPKRQRVALWLVAGEGFSYAEVAEVLGAGEQSVKALVHRARSSVVSKLAAARKGEVAAVAIGRPR